MYRSVAHVLFFLTLILSAFAAVLPRTPSEAEPVEIEERSTKISVSGKHTGQATWFDTGLGACGETNKDSDLIVAVSHTLFDNYPGYKNGNPNANPVCNKKIKATYKGKSVTVKVVDRCVGCATYDLDFTPAAFKKLAPLDDGRLTGMTWTFE